MKLKRIAFIVSIVFCATLSAIAQSKPASPRGAVETFFSLLKAQKYDALYDSLPSQFQQQTTREQLVQSLKRLNGFLAIEKLEIGRVQQRGDYAVVDTTIHGRLKQSIKLGKLGDADISEGRVNAQQYLFREDGKWKLATADNRSQSFFLKRNPEFNQQFQLTRPRLEFRRNDKWEAFGPKTPADPLTKPKR